LLAGVEFCFHRAFKMDTGNVEEPSESDDESLEPAQKRKKKLQVVNKADIRMSDKFRKKYLNETRLPEPFRDSEQVCEAKVKFITVCSNLKTLVQFKS
jgi:hypothetical protein